MKWIPMSESEPPLDTEVLLTVLDEIDDESTRHTVMGKMAMWQDESHQSKMYYFIINEDIDQSPSKYALVPALPIRYDLVTAWMELPNPWSSRED